MDATKQERLKAAGFTVGSVAEFLGLSPEEEAMIEIKLALRAAVKQRRQGENISQTALAKRLNSSQSRVAKLEAGDSSVSIDLLIRALLATGATRTEIGNLLTL